MTTDFFQLLQSVFSKNEPPTAEEFGGAAKAWGKMKKELEKMDFKIARTLKDKEIAITLLESSLADLESSNRTLSLRNEEIQIKNLELSHQKILLEDSGRNLSARLHDLKQSYEELEQFSEIASHDLKTPLRSIAGYAQLLQRRNGHKLDTESQEFIHFIVDGVKHLDEIIGALLDYSKTTGRQEAKAPTNMNLVLQTVENELAGELREAQGELRFGSLPTVRAVQASMVQLFQHLISNALKFRAEAFPVVEIVAENHGAVWQFNVLDNGVGIESSFAHKLFRPFQRLQTDRPGRGMGLAICKKIVHQHRGEIWCNPRPGGGSVFSFTLPAGVE